MSRFIAAIAALSPILPVTATVRTPYFFDFRGDDAEIFRLAIFGRRRPIEIVDRDIGAEFGQSLLPASHGRGRCPEPVTNAILPGKFLAHLFVSDPMIPSAFMFAALRRIMSSSY